MMADIALDPANLAFIIGVAFCASILGGLSGFGAGAIVAPFLLPFFDEKTVFPVVASAMLVGNMARVWVYRHSIDFNSVRNVILPVLPGIVVGVLIYDYLTPKLLSVLIGCILIGSVFLRRFMARRAIVPSVRGTVTAAFSAGVISANAPGGGVLIVSLLLGIGLQGATLIGTDAVIGVGLSLANSILFGTLGHLPLSALLVGLSIGAAMIPGAYVARWLMTKLSISVHLMIMEAFVIVSGLVFVWNGLTL